MRSRRILITGSEGLVGAGLRPRLVEAGFEVAGFDLRGLYEECGDVLDRERVSAAVNGCVGVVHLAAVSRVVWGERDPERCWKTNVEGLRTVIAAVEDQRPAPWLLFASSREVYGQAEVMPVVETAALRPVNVYARSKVEGERLVGELQARGVPAAVVRLSNVYGAAADHADRVIPAFVRAALAGEPLRVEGSGHTFDFTHLDDATRGLVSVAQALQQGSRDLPPVHLLTGESTTLGQLAQMIVEIVGSRLDVPWVEAPARTFDVGRFAGDPARAAAQYGWRAHVQLRDGLARLAADLRSFSTVSS